MCVVLDLGSVFLKGPLEPLGPALVMGIPPEEISAERVFDEGFATWVGITPDDHERREQEREGIQKLAKTDLRAYLEAMKAWGLSREKRFTEEGWRKMRGRA